MLHEHMARKAKCTEWVEFSCKLVHTTCSCFLCAAMGRTLRLCFLVLLFLSCRFELRSMCFAMSSHDRAKAEKPFIEANCFPPTRHMRQVKASGREIPILFYPVSKCRSYNPKYMISWAHSPNSLGSSRTSHRPDMNLSTDVSDMWDRGGDVDGPRKVIEEIGEGLSARAFGNRRGNRLLKVAVLARLSSVERGKSWWTTGGRVTMHQITNLKKVIHKPEKDDSFESDNQTSWIVALRTCHFRVGPTHQSFTAVAPAESILGQGGRGDDTYSTFERHPLIIRTQSFGCSC